MEEDAMPKRPWTVTAAFYLLCLSLVPLTIDIFDPPNPLPLINGVPLGLVFLGPWLLTMALLICMIGGRNCARVIVLILFLLAAPFSLLSIIQPSGHSALPGQLCEIIQLEIQLVAVVLLFQQSSSGWFKTMKKLPSKDESPKAI